VKNCTLSETTSGRGRHVAQQAGQERRPEEHRDDREVEVGVAQADIPPVEDAGDPPRDGVVHDVGGLEVGVQQRRHDAVGRVVALVAQVPGQGALPGVVAALVPLDPDPRSPRELHREGVKRAQELGQRGECGLPLVRSEGVECLRCQRGARDGAVCDEQQLRAASPGVLERRRGERQRRRQRQLAAQRRLSGRDRGEPGHPLAVDQVGDALGPPAQLDDLARAAGSGARRRRARVRATNVQESRTGFVSPGRSRC
jgi:hypothetical protein